MSKKSKNAGDFLAELEADTEYQKRRADGDVKFAERDKELAADEHDLVEEIRNIGYSIDSVYDFVNNSPHPVVDRRFIGEYPNAYKTLAAHLRKPHHPIIREGIIRSLAVSDGGMLVEEALLEAFRSESDVNLRWVLANALMIAMPHHRQKEHPEIAEVYKRGGGV